MTKSITFRITGWLFLVMTALMLMTFAVFRLVSGSILQKTVRGYLLSSVDQNVNKISYYTCAEIDQAGTRDPNDVYIRYGEGWLEIDDDFLDEINDVQSALYTADGRMLYGKNPIAKDMEGESFSSSMIYPYKTGGGHQYFVYDRKLAGAAMEELWIRGVVPLWSEQKQLADIFHMSMIFVPVLLLAGFAGTYVAVRQSLQSIKRIRQTASAISQGTDLTRRIEIGAVDTELHALAEAFNGMLDRLERSFEAERQFTSDASHELRTPLAVILAQTELALEKERPPEEYRRALSVIRRQGRRMQGLVTSMLDYTRMEMRPGEYPFLDLDLSALAEAVAQDMALIRAKNIALATDIQAGIQICGNRILLERALQNLIGNAYQYGRENGHIHVRLEGRDNRALLTVSDDGIGIPAKDQPRIFERFFRGDSSRSSRTGLGAGLGLSMVKKIMEIHGGDVTVESAPQKGSAFCLVFPRKD